MEEKSNFDFIIKKWEESLKAEKKIVLASGYFNPLHLGHLEYLELAKKLGEKLIVIVNNDYQVKIKGSLPFMNQDDRVQLVKELKCVDEVFLSIDQDKSVCKSIEYLAKSKGGNIFAKGGDRVVGNIPEKEICEKLGIKIIDGLGEKIRASSELKSIPNVELVLKERT
jgi:cytidyltransferase-like protein